MQVQPHVENVRDQLRASAELGDERTQQIAAALATSADAAVRLAVLNAVSAATAEITAALFDAGAAGSPAVTVQVHGDELRFRVTVAPDEPTRHEPPRGDDGDATARISLLLPEKLKSDVEQAANRDSVSVNTWLVRAASAAIAGGTRPRSDDGWTGDRGRGARRITGWVTG